MHNQTGTALSVDAEERIDTGSVSARERPYLLTPKEDNYSREIARLEDERMWGKVWLIACREQELEKAGDFVTFDIGRDSIIIVRQRDDSLKAFYNVCQHRGRRLKTEPSGNTRTSIRCGFHSWRWTIDGQLQYVSSANDYDGFRLCSREEMALKEVKVDTWGGWVWISMNPDIEPLLEYLDPFPGFIDPFELENCSIAWHKTVIFPCNWKTVLEAFSEGYHVEGTHSQLLKYGRRRTISRAYGDHGWFGYPAHGEEPEVETAPDAKAMDPARGGIDYRQLMYAFQVEGFEWLKCLSSEYTVEASRRAIDALPPDASADEVRARTFELHRDYIKEIGARWPERLTPEVMAAAGTDWHLFPNAICLPAIDGAEWYRCRPNGDDPESCIFDVWWLQRYPADKVPPIKHDFYPTPEAFKGENRFLEQDFDNLKAVQQGMHSRGFDGQRTNPRQEVAISNFHRALHRYLGLGEQRFGDVDQPDARAI